MILNPVDPREEFFLIGIRERLAFAVIALVGAFFIIRLVTAPTYTDAYYHLNAANRFVTGQGLTDPYLWTYIAEPDQLPAPSHLYWMPFTSLTAALGMVLWNAPQNYAAAQFFLVLMLAGTVYIGFYLGERLGQSRRHAWSVGLLTLFSGYFARFWGAIDTFTPFAFVGALALLFLGFSVDESLPRRRWLIWIILSGVFAALAHLTRADGVLFLLVGWSVLIWSLLFHHQSAFKDRLFRCLVGILVMTFAYLLTMTPWFIRNINLVGSPLPVGGTQTIWFTSYDDIFNYPPDSSPATLFANGLTDFLASRWLALTNNLGTFIAVEGLIVMTPLMLIGLWRRRHQSFLRPFWIYALGMHLAMTFVFPFPGYRGGLFHSAAALVPWWAALGILGLDDVIEWVSKRRRRWNARTAKQFFSGALVLIALALTLALNMANPRALSAPTALYQILKDQLPEDARLMVNDPAQLYYFTGFQGVVLPNEEPDVIPEIANRYGVRYLLLEQVSDDGTVSGAATSKLWSILTSPPDFLLPIPLPLSDVRLYEILD